MSPPVVETLPHPTQKILSDIQESLLPLLEYVESTADNGYEVFKHQSELGNLAVFRNLESLEVRVSEPWRKTPAPEEFDILPIRLEAQFTRLPSGKVEASPLGDGRAFTVFMLAQNAHFSGRYVPYNWRDGGMSLESERFGSLPVGDIYRLSQFMHTIVGQITAEVVSQPSENIVAA